MQAQACIRIAVHLVFQLKSRALHRVCKVPAVPAVVAAYLAISCIPLVKLLAAYCVVFAQVTAFFHEGP